VEVHQAVTLKSGLPCRFEPYLTHQIMRVLERGFVFLRLSSQSKMDKDLVVEGVTSLVHQNNTNSLVLVLEKKDMTTLSFLL